MQWKPGSEVTGELLVYWHQAPRNAVSSLGAAAVEGFPDRIVKLSISTVSLEARLSVLNLMMKVLLVNGSARLILS